MTDSQQFSISGVLALQRAVSAGIFFCPSIFPRPALATRANLYGLYGPTSVSPRCQLCSANDRQQRDSAEQEESGPGLYSPGSLADRSL